MTILGSFLAPRRGCHERPLQALDTVLGIITTSAIGVAVFAQFRGAND